ncbi:hypothetical protein CRUP_021885, partial [Coryphaenoides rupestris]
MTESNTEDVEPRAASPPPHPPPHPPPALGRMSRTQIFTLISVASVNFGSMICYSILAPFFPYEAVQKGASQTVVGLIFGSYALSNFIGSLIMGRYIVQIGAKFMLVAGLFLDRAPSGATFISLCFFVRTLDAMGFAAAFTSSTALASKVFPHNVATILGSLQIFTGLGLILGPPFGGWMYQAAGYELPFMVLGCVLLLMVPFNFFADPSGDSFLQLLRLPKVLLICFVIFTFSSGLGFLDTTLSLFAINT